MNIKDQILKILVEEDMFQNEVDDLDSNFHFVIKVLSFNIDVIQPLNKEDSVIIGCASQLLPEQMSIMKSFKSSLYNEFLWDLRLSLNSFLVDFQLSLNPVNNMLQQYIITDYIFFDEISKNDLVQTIRRVSKAKIQCEYFIERTFGEVAPTQSSI